MQLNQFKFLVAVDQYGSISRAAQELYISQSTVSMALIAMEEELGVTLLSRGKKGVAITEEGKLVLEKAKVIMNEVNALQATSFDYETLTGEVFVGGSSHLCMNIITDMAIQMKQLHPAVSILTKRQNTKDIIKSIAQKELDIGFIHYNTLNEYDILAELRRYHMEWVPLFQDKQCICVSDHHPLYGKKSLPIETLFPYEIVSLAKENGFKSETLEKVLRLIDVLNFINKNSDLANYLVLKGGTAINFTIFNLPRLSVDIDLDFSFDGTKEEMLTKRNNNEKSNA